MLSIGNCWTLNFLWIECYPYPFQIFNNANLVRPIAAVPTQSQLMPAPAQLSAVRSFQTTSVTKDIDSAAKFIGAGAATVGVAGSGMNIIFSMFYW